MSKLSDSPGMKQILQQSLGDYKNARAAQQTESLRLTVSALQAQVQGLDQSRKQAEEMCVTLMNAKLSPSELGEHVFAKLTEHMAKRELTRSQTYAAVLQNTILALDQIIQRTSDADAKDKLIEIVKNLHITVKA